MPPTRTVAEYGVRESLAVTRQDLLVLLPLTIKTGFLVARKDVLGVITASGLGRRRSRTLAKGAGFADNSAVGRVEDASVFAVGDVLQKEDGTDIGTVLSIDTSTNPDTVTLTGNAAVAIAADVPVLGSDGSQVAKAIADGESDGVGDTPLPVAIGGLVKEADIRGLDASAKTELGGVSTIAGIFKF